MLAQKAFCFVMVLVLVGCGTVQFTSDRENSLSKKIPTVKTVKKKIKNKVKKEPWIRVHRHGRFTVESYPDKDVIFGGVFNPEPLMPHDSKYKHVIFINYETKELTYYRLEGNVHKPILGFAVMTPNADFLPKDLVRGRVFNIDTKPTWCPTSNIRRAYPDLPEGCLPHGHEMNAMGDTKFEINWEVSGWEAVRLHETGGYAEGDFWSVSTFGCTRLKKELMQKLLVELGDLKIAIQEGIEIVAFRS